ncbi:YtzI protein [Litchfieldia alkalitelluris]|uniref:YtzI protein n=1 Tax=Litchfieldia alkalitelluris TaxID=304268 RepID=UPI00099631DF|nr:YtzI protein [Litchfieldia alkalitelluris]
MYTLLGICIIIVIVILLLSLLTTSKAYEYKHTIDPLEDHPLLEEQNLDNETKGDEHNHGK